jgi:hypothetical protein
MSALAREAYRKCMQDYVAGGAPSAPQTPSVAPPVQQQAVQQPPQQQAVQQPVQQARPKPAPQQAQQKPRVQQAQRVKQERPEPQTVYRPVLPGLIGFGLGIGLGGIRP